jgi:hypothetical protein
MEFKMLSAGERLVESILIMGQAGGFYFLPAPAMPII